MKTQKILLLTFAIAMFVTTQAQIQFQNHIIIDNTYATDGAHSVYATDIDGDGDMDVLLASWDNNKISWYENIDGQGAFSRQQIITTDANGASSVYATDIDGDGDMDVISSSRNDDKIAWYMNNDGQGTFGPQQIITTDADGVLSTYAADLDGDGDMDVLSASGYDNKIAWYENTNGLGNFGSQQIIATDTKTATTVFATDIDGDGDMDVLSAFTSDYPSFGGKVVWYENTDGMGSFSSQHIISTAAAGSQSVYATDIDSDGDMDVLLACMITNPETNENQIVWFENSDGQGSFGQKQTITIDADGANSVYASDIDNDGDMDVLSACSGADPYFKGKVIWFKNSDGQGTFGQQQIITTNTEGASSVYAADLDGDGELDVLSASWGDDKVAWYKNGDGQGTFGEQQIIRPCAFADKPQSIYAADIDGDGDMDVLSASKNDDKIAWYKNTDGQGTFGSQQIITLYANGANSVYATDFDDDGDMDVLSASRNDDKIAWYENIDGQGDFGAQQIITTDADVANSVYATDIDGDGDMDVLSASFGSYYNHHSKVAWYENNDGQGTFSPEQLITTGVNGISAVYASDLDNDGDMDVLSASCWNDNKIVWYENTDGLGAFGNQHIVTTIAFNAQSVYTADIDGDGDMDVLSASRVIAWYENIDGQGTYGSQQIITTDVDGAQSVYATDIDSDGDMDVLSASKDDNKIAWYENIDGQGSFGSQQIITTEAIGAKSVFAADIDGDGDMDVLSASDKDHKIVWYENLLITDVKQHVPVSFLVFPNPASSKIVIAIKNGTPPKEITIYNLIGQSVIHKKGETKTVNVSMLPRGVYIIEIESDSEKVRSKLMIE